MKAVFVPAAGKLELIELAGDPLQAMYAVLECQYVEALSIGHEKAMAWGDEEAKLVNREAYVCPTCGDESSLPGPCGGVTSGKPHPPVEVEKRWVEGKPENKLATALVYGDKEEARKRGEQELQYWRDQGYEVFDATGNDPREPFVAGDIVITGRTHDGDTTDVPLDVIRTLLPLGALAVLDAMLKKEKEQRKEQQHDDQRGGGSGG